MADIDERPSKIRKLDDSEQSSAIQAFTSPKKTSQPQPHSEQNEGTTSNQAEDKQTRAEAPAVPLSKNQLKKLRKREQWEAGKAYRAEKRRDKHKDKQARKAAEREELKQRIANGEIEAPKPPEKGKHPKRPAQLPLSLIIDCDFSHLMTEKEIISTSAQLTRCYSDNRSSRFRVHLGMSSWGGVLKTRFENVLASQHLLWKGVNFFEGDFEAAAKAEDGIMRARDGGRLAGALAPGFKYRSAEATKPEESTGALEPSPVPKTTDTTQEERCSAPAKEPDAEVEEEVTTIFSASDSAPPPGQAQPEDSSMQSSESEPSPPSIVYLTSDSPHTLDELSPYTSYIIGGIVDKNRHKGLCYKRAMERGIPTARLPIGEYMTIQGRTVLTINHVVEIMLKWLEIGDWGEAFVSVIPKRKEAKLRPKKGGNGGLGGEEGSDEGDEEHVEPYEGDDYEGEKKYYDDEVEDGGDRLDEDVEADGSKPES